MAQIQILGSAAAEGIPAIFCNCRVCREAWQNGGKDIRMRAAYKINEHVRIDFGPDSIAQEYRYQLHSENLKHLFITPAINCNIFAFFMSEVFNKLVSSVTSVTFFTVHKWVRKTAQVT